MKRLIIVVIALLILITQPALASVDLASMATNELIALKLRILAELFERGELSGVIVPVEVYVAGSLDEGNYERQRDAGLRIEAQNAIVQLNAMSRLGATSTSNTLGKIRQYVHGVEVLNDLNISMYGEAGRLFQSSVFDHINETIDRYDLHIHTGQNADEELSTLSEAVNELNDRALRIQFGE